MHILKQCFFDLFYCLLNFLIIFSATILEIEQNLFQQMDIEINIK